MNRCDCKKSNDHGGNPYIADIEKITLQNNNFRTAVWTGNYLQMTLMCIPPCGEIGLEIHRETDQFLRIEQGRAEVYMGESTDYFPIQKYVCKGDGIFVPAGIWHNIINIGNIPLKLYSIYAPPHHPKGTIQRIKADEKNI
jgi:mannose-6-phosphate isomerase-like protein (cupin superfamily)